MDVKDKLIGLINRNNSAKEDPETKAKLAKKIFMNVEKQYALITPDEKEILNLKDLAHFLRTAPKETYEDFIKKDTNNISVWVTATVGDEALGDKLAKLKKQEDIAKEIESRIRELDPYMQANPSNNKANAATPAASTPNGKEKTIVELLAEEGVQATESAPTEEPNHGAPLASMNDLVINVERIEGKLDMFDQFRKSSDERIGDLAERIGELRQMLLDKERDFNEVQHMVDKNEELIGDIDPEAIRKELEKSGLELEKRDAKIEKLEDFAQLLSKELGEYRDRMGRIKDFENLMESLRKVKEEVNKINESKKYMERLSAKNEQVFAELNESTVNFKNQVDSVKKMEELTQELLVSVDELKDKQAKSISKKELDQFKDQMLKMDLGTTKADFEKTTKSLEEEIIKIKDNLSLMEFRTKSVSDLIDEKVRTTALIDKLSRDYSQKLISDRAYLDASKNAKKRLKEIEETLQRVDRETLYNDLNKITKVVNEHAAKVPLFAQKEEIERVTKLLEGLQHKIEDTNIDKTLQTLDEAKSNMFERIRQTEKELRELDLDSKKMAQGFADIETVKSANKEFERLLSSNLSEIEDVKGILSAMENKIEGDVIQKIANLEYHQKAQESSSEETFSAAKKELDLFVREKIRIVESFEEELKALKQGKSMMFDKMNAVERNSNEVKESLSSMQNELRVIAPKISSIENDINGSLSPELYAVRSKLAELEALKAGVDNIRNSIDKINSANYADKIEAAVKISERAVSSVRDQVAGIQEELAEFVPKIALAENAIESSLTPDVNAIKAKMIEIDTLKSEINSTKNTIEKISSANYADKIDAIAKIANRSAAELEEINSENFNEKISAVAKTCDRLANELKEISSENLADRIDAVSRICDKSAASLKEDMTLLQSKLMGLPSSDKVDSVLKIADKANRELKDEISTIQHELESVSSIASELEETTKANDKAITELKEEILGVQDELKMMPRTERLDNFIKSYDKSVNDVRERMTTLQSTLKEMGPKTDRIGATAKTNERAISEIKGKLAAMLDDLKMANAHNEKLESASKSNEKSIGEAKEKMYNLQNEVKSIGPKLSSLQNNIESTLSPELNTLWLKVTELEAMKLTLDDVQNEVDKLSASKFIERIDTLAKSTDKAISIIKGKVASLQDTLKSIDPKISAIEDHVDGTLTPELESLKSDIENLRKETDKVLSPELESLRSEFERLSRAMSKGKGDSMAETVSMLSKQIRQMRNDLYGKE